MAVQSIGAAIQIRDVAGDHLLVTPRKMPLGKMDGVGEFDYLAQEIWPCPEALDNSWNFLSSRSRAPKVVGCGDVAGGIGVFGDRDFGPRIGDRSLFRRLGRFLFIFHRRVQS